MKVSVAILCRNAEKTLEKTYFEIPEKYRKNAFLSDDNSTDSTIEIAKKLKLKVHTNPRKGGYGSNAKNCFNSAIKEGADIVVILHSDNQYEAAKIPALVKPIEERKADFTIGSRMIGSNPESIPLIRYYGNRGLTMIQNIVMGTRLTDLHSGLVVLSTGLIKKIPYLENYDDYSFHSEIVMQSSLAKAKFAEVGIETRYEGESQSTSFFHTIAYGLRTLKIIGKYVLHKSRIKKFSNLEIK